MGRTAKDTPKQPTLIPQPNGKGALLSGGMPGNKGGGDHPDNIRRAFRSDVAIAREKIMELLEADGLSPGEIIQYIDKAAKYSIGKPITRDELKGILTRMWELVVQHNGIEDATERLATIQRDWKGINA